MAKRRGKWAHARWSRLVPAWRCCDPVAEPDLREIGQARGRRLERDFALSLSCSVIPTIRAAARMVDERIE
jgi:hypothetical protein